MCLPMNVEMRSILKIVLFHLLFCHSLGAYSENFEIKTENLNKRLVPYTFLEKIVGTHHDCVRECFHYGGQCKAINYNLKSRTCELKSKGSADSVDVSEYVHAAGYIFTDITDWPTLTLSECSKNNCLDKQTCLPHGNTASGCMDKADCGTAPVIQFATVTAWVTTEGAFATYSCDFGYELSGTISKVTCTGGLWTAEGPIACIPKDCGQADGVSNGSVYAPVTTHGATATYTCDVEYQITDGNAVRTCTDGVWVGTIPVCSPILDCGTAPVIQFATVTARVTTEGAFATYSCDFGYELSGTISEVTCKGSVWTAEGLIECIPKECGQPAGITHGSVNAPVTTHGATANYTCDVGYQITGGNAVRTCTDGVWVGTIPVCSPIPNVGCYYAGQSHLYVGPRRTTKTGRYCQRWDSQSPHLHIRTTHDTFPSGDLSVNENFCRDPDNEGQPWCYTIDLFVRWEFCGIPLC